MAETYQLTWGEANHMRDAINLAKQVPDDADYAHLETKAFDLDIDRIGISVRIPHDSGLDEERKTL